MQGLPYIRRQFDFSKIFDLEEFNKQFDTIPKNNVALETGAALSSVGYIQPHLDPKFSEFTETLLEICSLFYSNITKESAGKYITRSWTNRHLRTGQTAEHRHEGVELVLSCYIRVPKDSGNFELYYNGDWHTVPVATNDILVFSGNLLHRTEASCSDLPRIVVTLNITENLQASIANVEQIYKDTGGQPDPQILHREFVNMIGRIADNAARVEVKLLEME